MKPSVCQQSSLVKKNTFNLFTNIKQGRKAADTNPSRLFREGTLFLPTGHAGIWHGIFAWFILKLCSRE